MTSIRHNGGPDDSLLDAARACILAVGWTRTTLTDVARRAGVSRMTIYRRWPDMQTLLSDLMTREWSGIALASTLDAEKTPGRQVADAVTGSVRGLRDNDLFRKIVEVDPDLLLPYLLDRRGRTQDSILGLLEAAIAEGQRIGSVRAGDPRLLARTVLLTAHGFALSAETMTTRADEQSEPASDDHDAADHLGLDDLDDELHTLVERYLSP
jgi:AcrR family transcriptional regulator